jgi:hypothetical protein
MVGIEPLCHQVGCHLERFAPRGGLDGLKVQLRQRRGTKQRFEFGSDFGL